MSNTEFLISELPDPDSSRRFLSHLEEKHPAQSKRLLKNDALLSDILTLVSYSPLIATTLLQAPEYIAWLGRKRADSAVRDKQELLESLARFSLTHSQLEPNVVLARFRRRELMRIFLRDIRRLATISEITEEISNLADAILEHALRLSQQELDNRFGQPQETDEKGRKRPAEFCIVSLGKLGSKELNYSSDIDLIFIYSVEGTTTGGGVRGATSNKEYFSRLAESVTKLVGGQGGEGAAYRVDMRLRPHGRVGPLALKASDTIRYYCDEAAAWERQVLIRSRCSAGSLEIFKRFADSVETVVFSADQSVNEALQNVAASKQKIDLGNASRTEIDIKLGRGGIREIEFIAQALQLAYGGRDEWLRAPHTLISLTRLSERGHISHVEHSKLFGAYELLRRLEHILQMENGLQTHLVPEDSERQELVARRMRFDMTAAFQREVETRMTDVNEIFCRVFQTETRGIAMSDSTAEVSDESEQPSQNDFHSDKLLKELRRVAPRFAALVDARPELFPVVGEMFPPRDFSKILLNAVSTESEFRERLGVLRRTWSRSLIEIAAYDVMQKVTLRESKHLQTCLAEASIETALWITTRELERRYSVEVKTLPLAVLGLGKLGSGALDYDSDLDLVMIYDALSVPVAIAPVADKSEFFARAVEIFTNVLSSVTREGSLYRVDLRLRPYGSKGVTAISADAIIEYFRSSAEVWELLAFVKMRPVGGDMELGKRMETELREIIFGRASRTEPKSLAAETLRIRLALEKQKLGRRSKDIDIKYGAGGLLDIYFAVRYLQLCERVPDNPNDRSTLAMLDRLSMQKPARKQGRYQEAKATEAVDESASQTEMQKPAREQGRYQDAGVTEATSERNSKVPGRMHDPEDERYTGLPGIALADARASASEADVRASALDSLREGYIFLAALDHNIRLTVGRSSRVPVANQHALEVIAERMDISSQGELFEQLTLHRLSIRSAFESVVGAE
ncbi:MAG: DUF294 nucleotidyltransferase-like domain-containing protein [Pyrinomonadaceae bacterium]